MKSLLLDADQAIKVPEGMPLLPDACLALIVLCDAALELSNCPGLWEPSNALEGLWEQESVIEVCDVGPGEGPRESMPLSPSELIVSQGTSVGREES